ncbi:MAG: TetR/AcrR family transcriptional regulator [Alphaproteobacteria bacterium]
MEHRTYTGKAAEILEIAERHMREGGFDAASFRDIAAQAGIKSASVHYHFPQKADLGVAVVHRYTDRVLAALAAPDDPKETVAARIERLAEVYRSAVLHDRLICLCAVLGAETLDLPKPVAEAVRQFFATILRWTETALATGQHGASPISLSAPQIVATLQGAMILALATKQPLLFTQTTDRMLAQCRSRGSFGSIPVPRGHGG